jgi:hypothetical protein
MGWVTRGGLTITKALDTSQPCVNSCATDCIGTLPDRSRLETEFFRQSYFRFIVNFLKAAEAGKGKPVDGYRADFADGRVFYRWSPAFSMNQDEHIALLSATLSPLRGVEMYSDARDY